MWCKELRRFPSALGFQNSAKIARGSRLCQGARRLSSTVSSGADNTGGQKHSKSQSNGQTYQRWSRSQVAAILAGVGISLGTYMRWTQSQAVYAKEENEKPEGVAANPKEGSEEKEKTNNEPDWSAVPDIPSHVPYLLIGGGVASLEAFVAIKTKDVNAKVLMITDEDYPPYIRPPLSKQFWHDEDVDAYKQFAYTNSRGKKLSVFRYDGLYMEPKKLPYSERGGLALLRNKKVVRLDTDRKMVELEDGTQISFDKCLIATGGKPKNHPILEKAGEDVKVRTILFRNLRDLYKLSEVTKVAKSVAVVGGGFLGSELAVGLGNRGKASGMEVYQVFPEKGNMAKVLPDFLSDWTRKKVEQRGIKVIPNTSIESAVFEDGKVKLGLSKGKYLSVDCVVVAVGIEPNTDLATSGHLELDDKFGGFRVNTELQARTDIYAAGDCACFYDSKLGRRRVEHYDHAELTGRLAGFNMAGESQAYTHQSAFWCILGSGVNYEAVGLIDSSLETFSVFRKKTEKKKKVEDSSKDSKDEKKTEKVEKTKKAEQKTAKKATKTTKSESKEEKTSDQQSQDVTETEGEQEDEYSRGLIFYLRDGAVVGVVLWNLDGFTGDPPRMEIARQVIADGARGQDLTEVAKLFNIYSR